MERFVLQKAKLFRNMVNFQIKKLNYSGFRVSALVVSETISKEKYQALVMSLVWRHLAVRVDVRQVC